MKDLWARKEAFIRYENNQMVVTSPFDRSYVNELKSETVSRRWNSDKSVWVVDITERDKVLKITQQYFDIIEENQPLEGAKVMVEEPNDPVSDESPLEVQIGDKVEIWTDGACAINPGPGGYAVLFRHNSKDRELVGGYTRTTNNRMEMMAAIVALETLKKRCKVTIYSDSLYLINPIKKGWAKHWQAKNWTRNDKESRSNADLWQRLLSAMANHGVNFIWVKGHASNAENERCNELAEAATLKPDLPKDSGFEDRPK